MQEEDIPTDTRYRDDPAYREKKLNYWRTRSASMTPEQRRTQWLWKKYKITPEQFDARLAEQVGMCGLCAGDACSRGWMVDHDHDTGALRGILCFKCNRGLGALGDNAAALRRALDYLEAPSWQT